MHFIFTRLGRYLIAQTVSAIALTLAGVAATTLLVDVVEQLRTVGARTELSLGQALFLTLLKTPQLIEQTLPFIVLVGVMIALLRLNRRSELVAIRASGVSAWRFLAPAATVAFAIGVFASLVLNPVGARLYELYEAETGRLTGRDKDAVTRTGIWLRQGDQTQQIVIHADAVDPRRATLERATLMVFNVSPDGSLAFARRIVAAEAALRPGFWQLRDVVEAGQGQALERHAQLAIPTPLQPSALFDRFVNPVTLSFWRLPSFIAQARAAGLAPVVYELKWHALLATPALLMAMAALGAVFSLRLQRLGGVAQWAMTGVSIGFLLFFLGRLIGAFASAEMTPPFLAAWAPPVAGFFGAMAVLSSLEDG